MNYYLSKSTQGMLGGGGGSVFNSLLSELPDNENHVHTAASFPNATLGLR